MGFKDLPKPLGLDGFRDGIDEQPRSDKRPQELDAPKFSASLLDRQYSCLQARCETLKDFNLVRGRSGRFCSGCHLLLELAIWREPVDERRQL